MNQLPPDADGRRGFLGNTEVIVALIGAAATVLAALLAGYFGLVGRNDPPATPLPIVTPGAQPAVTIDGPPAAPLGQLTYFTIISANAERAAWSIGGFNNNEAIEIDPLPPSYQIQIEPTNASRVGDLFTLVVTAYDRAGNSATATHEFTVTDADQ